MNKDIIQGNWTEVKGRIKKHWGEFTDDEITKMKGSTQELAGALQKKYGYSQEIAEKKLNEFIKEHGWKEKDDV